MGGGKGGGSTSNYTERPLTSQELALLDTQNTAIKQQMSLADRMVGLSEQSQKDWENTYKTFETNDLKNALVNANANMGKVDDTAYSSAKANLFNGLSSGYSQAQKDLDAQMAKRGLSNSGASVAAMKDLYSNKANAMAQAGNQAYNQGVQAGDAYRQQTLSNLSGYAQLGRGMSGQASNYLQGATGAYGGVSQQAGGTASSLGGLNTQYNSAQWNANAQAQAGKGAMGGSLLGAGASLGSAYMMAGAMSDARLKDNITPIGHYDGLVIYKWKWNDKAKELGADTLPNIGFIAQEVMEVMPDAVIIGDDGYYRVNYSMILED